ncbi:hypothetical protein I7I50_06165 [Histoplasma capsulatum G186AR]|uniref:Uncharacterized protein n=1 Tax=Ajellomyces capsulatus TaxID=5037 RepID=A0A8H7Z182_AJECA|nr:hypothetical protein I7I52_10757 [Histoplasma capsulatum]QSS67166.1 hypothetical protein I7I50_06165 [Histoplasma capsulatum G186AR]
MFPLHVRWLVFQSTNKYKHSLTFILYFALVPSISFYAFLTPCPLLHMMSSFFVQYLHSRELDGGY